MAFLGSMTRKYTTALTFTVTLSLVITSWEGTSMVTVLRLTRTIFWIPGQRKMIPGPFTPCSMLTFPSVKITPRSYCFRILTMLYNMAIAMMTIKSKLVANTCCMASPPLQCEQFNFLSLCFFFTLTFRPSTAMTMTCSPFCIGSSLQAFQYSPRMKTCPSERMSVFAVACMPVRPSLPVVGFSR